ncbi:methyltransferase, putative [Plasmodium berghei]|uniref:tRNA N(3)-methylcytidine methyltransferase n=2 Tax=Plasmodium berghei TaxID=5821 RepID=A0A509B1Z2_PLABA|nr:methyltransferase, putative [Plasmodium berghei ANKA]CXJ28938.1 methyltransferase, putative [Plasmodium berghei]SCM27065.1 methyltransferase, putative [Plasmodium berghei]SCN28791.1 methyltransferase, putative [Plasmodium berghei]SCO63079.1 methyltransferase, putative [Plasmodium berghei]SCO64538.1 methyltransferase, putative [Plasmodium berghei]|eukprot:XP_034424437.1 methyltransferase, putative [Plasmodium berghei ANKA]
MRPFFDSDIVVNFTLSEEVIQREKKIIENNKRAIHEFQKEKLLQEGKKNWDKFYNHYKTNFFKDRKWIKVEFDHIFKDGDLLNDSKNYEKEQKEKRKIILEMGCGVGNTLIPLLLEYCNCDFIGIDFSKNAINLLNEKWKKIVHINETLKNDQMNSHKDAVISSDCLSKEKMNEQNLNDLLSLSDISNTENHKIENINDAVRNNISTENGYIMEYEDQGEGENYSCIYDLKEYKKLGNLIKTLVVDITSDSEVSTDLNELGFVDVVLLIYVLSSVSPEKMINVILNSYKYLKSGGYVLLRDYGLYDLTQVRFANKKEKKISDNFYVRGDKTFVYFFTTEELRNLFCQNDMFEEIQNKYITRIVKNRKRNLEMKRIWVQSIFRKK